MASDGDSWRTVERATVRDSVELAYLRAGAGGYPLLLVHGWPETKRIWWRNVADLAAAGFEVIVPDLRGFGESSLAPDGFYDIAAHARDLHALVSGTLGHARCSAAGGDLGGPMIHDLGLRFPGFVERQVIFNGPLPLLPDRYEAAGLPPLLPREQRMAADYYLRQAREADALAAELDTPDRRRRYIADFYGHRFWAAPGAFRPDDIAFMVEPFADAGKLRAGFGNYESSLGQRAISEQPRFDEPSPVRTLVLYGPEDHVVPRDFCARAEIAFPDRVGPFVVPGAGHFLQWERSALFDEAVATFLEAPRRNRT